MESKLTINSVKGLDLFKDIYAVYYCRSTPYEHNMFDNRGIFQSVNHFIEGQTQEVYCKYLSSYQRLYSNLALKPDMQTSISYSLVHQTARNRIVQTTTTLAKLILNMIDETIMYINIYCTFEQLAGQKILFFYSDSPYYSKRLWNKFCKFNNLNIKFFDDHTKLADDLLTIKPFILDNVNDVKAIKYLKPEQQNSEFMETVVNEYILSKI